MRTAYKGGKVLLKAQLRMCWRGPLTAWFIQIWLAIKTEAPGLISIAIPGSVCVTAVWRWALRGGRTSSLTPGSAAAPTGSDAHSAPSPNWRSVNEVWRGCSVTWRGAADAHARSFPSAQMFACWARRDDAQGLRPAPVFHTWRDPNKGRDFQTPVTPNNIPTPPRAPLLRPSARLSSFLKLNTVDASAVWSQFRTLNLPFAGSIGFESVKPHSL